MGKDPSAFKEDIQYTKHMLQVIPDPIYEMTPLYAAAFKGDMATIHKLSELGVNPNIKNKINGYTALHAAVFRSKKESVFQILDSFRGLKKTLNFYIFSNIYIIYIYMRELKFSYYCLGSNFQSMILYFRDIAVRCTRRPRGHGTAHIEQNRSEGNLRRYLRGR